MATNLIGFLRQLRYPLWEFFSAVQNGEQQRLLIEQYGVAFLREYDFRDDEFRKLNRAIAMAQFMSHGGSISATNFRETVEQMTEEEWILALRHSPYHEKHARLEGLELNLEALKNEILNLHSIAGRMASAARISWFDAVDYDTAQRQAAGTLLAIGSLHAAHIDTSRTLREKQFGEKQHIADRAVKRICKPVAAQHDFLKDLRNCVLHYSIPKPHIRLILSERDENYRFYLSAGTLLNCGYKWKNATRQFLSQQEDGEIRILELTRSILRNVEKQVEFLFRCIARASMEEKLNYESYKALRDEVARTQSKNLTRAFQVHGTWRKRHPFK